MSGQTDRGTVKAAYITAAASIVAALIALAGGFVNGHYQRQIGVEQGQREAGADIRQQLTSEYNRGYSVGYAAGQRPPIIPTTKSDYDEPTSSTQPVKYLLDTNPLRSEGWRVNNRNPIDTRDQRLANDISYVVAIGLAGYATTGPGFSWAEYPVDENYNHLHFQIAPHESFRNEPEDKQASLVISVKRVHSDMLDIVYPSSTQRKDIFNASSSKLEKDIDLGKNVEYLGPYEYLTNPSTT